MGDELKEAADIATSVKDILKLLPKFTFRKRKAADDDMEVVWTLIKALSDVVKKHTEHIGTLANATTQQNDYVRRVTKMLREMMKANRRSSDSDRDLFTALVKANGTLSDRVKQLEAKVEALEAAEPKPLRLRRKKT